MGNLRFRRSLGLFLVAISAVFSFDLYLSLIQVETTTFNLIISGIIVWCSLCMPELAIGIWLMSSRVEIDEIPDAIGESVESTIDASIDDEPPEPGICPNCKKTLNIEDEVVCPHCEHVVISSLL